jgi:hypothetical protein
MEKRFADFLCVNHVECNSGHQKNYTLYILTDRPQFDVHATSGVPLAPSVSFLIPAAFQSVTIFQLLANYSNPFM